MSETMARGSIVVGLDEHGQPASTLLAAADAAHERGLALAIVTVVRPKLDPGLNLIGSHRHELLAKTAALHGLHQAATAAHSRHPNLRAVTYCLTDSEVGSTREPLSRAELLVLGTQDRYGRQALVLGSVSRLLLTSSRCPVLVVPDQSRRQQVSGRPPLIVVGVSQHPADTAAVRAACTAASYRGGVVTLVHAYSPHRGETSDQARKRAHAILTGCIGHCPTGIRVSVAAVEDKPAAALLRLAAEASLLVVGGRTGALSGLIRDSVSHAVLEAAPCPVLAVPRDRTETQLTPLNIYTLDPVHPPHPMPTAAP